MKKLLNRILVLTLLIGILGMGVALAKESFVSTKTMLSVIQK